MTDRDAGPGRPTAAPAADGAVGTARSRDRRRQLIAEHVVEHGTATVSEIAALTGVSVMTVHRDLDELAARGVLRRFRGGVSALPSSVFESSLAYRLGVRLAEKEAIAAAAAALVEPGMSVMLDDSTTALALARRLAADGAPLTVLSNARRVIDVFAGQEDVRLIALGGEYSPTHDSYLGVPCVEAIEALSVDLVMVSTSAMDAESTYHQEQDVVLVKRAMLRSGDRSVLLMDHSKMPRTTLHRLCPVADFDHLVVDPGVDRRLSTELRRRTNLIVADGTS